MSNVTVSIDKDEWYPVWSATRVTDQNPDPYGENVEVPRETLDRWIRVFAEFDEVQTEIAALGEARP